MIISDFREVLYVVCTFLSNQCLRPSLSPGRTINCR